MGCSTSSHEPSQKRPVPEWKKHAEILPDAVFVHFPGHRRATGCYHLFFDDNEIPSYESGHYDIEERSYKMYVLNPVVDDKHRQQWALLHFAYNCYTKRVVKPEITRTIGRRTDGKIKRRGRRKVLPPGRFLWDDKKKQPIILREGDVLRGEFKGHGMCCVDIIDIEKIDSIHSTVIGTDKIKVMGYDQTTGFFEKPEFELMPWIGEKESSRSKDQRFSDDEMGIINGWISVGRQELEDKRRRQTVERNRESAEHSKNEQLRKRAIKEAYFRKSSDSESLTEWYQDFYERCKQKYEDKQDYLNEKRLQRPGYQELKRKISTKSTIMETDVSDEEDSDSLAPYAEDINLLNSKLQECLVVD